MIRLRSALSKALAGLTIAVCAIAATLFVPDAFGDTTTTDLSTQSPPAIATTEPVEVPEAAPLTVAAPALPDPPVPSETPEATPIPAAVVVAAPTESPAPTPIATDSPSESSALSSLDVFDDPVTEEAAEQDLVEPTAAATVQATVEPTPTATSVATTVPTVESTAVPTEEPTAEPTPTVVATVAPTAVPTAAPTPIPTVEPTAVPTAAPTPTATAEPTPDPADAALVPAGWMYVDSDTGLFLRDQPGGEIINVLVHRTAVYVSGRGAIADDREWVEVQSPSPGWVALTFLTLTEPAPLPTPAVPTGPSEPPTPEDWAAMRNCESGGRYDAVDPSGLYHGAYQFLPSTWDGLARRFWPELVGVLPSQASPADQDKMAQQLFELEGARPWPLCGRYLL